MLFLKEENINIKESQRYIGIVPEEYYILKKDYSMGGKIVEYLVSRVPVAVKEFTKDAGFDILFTEYSNILKQVIERCCLYRDTLRGLIKAIEKEKGYGAKEILEAVCQLVRLNKRDAILLGDFLGRNVQV